VEIKAPHVSKSFSKLQIIDSLERKGLPPSVLDSTPKHIEASSTR
jgi:hypothetical protein